VALRRDDPSRNPWRTDLFERLWRNRRAGLWGRPDLFHQVLHGAYAGRFDGFHAVPAAVSSTCLVRFDNNKYSVMASAVGRPVEVRAYAERIEIRQDGRVVAEHPRAFSRGQTVFDPWRVSGARSLRRRVPGPPAQRRSRPRREPAGRAASPTTSPGSAWWCWTNSTTCRSRSWVVSCCST
jgi:hypothetical protein